MADHRPTMGADIVKGTAKPIANEPAWKQKTSVTVRLDDERYRKLMAVSSSRIPRITHQQIIIDALDLYFEAHNINVT